ncbi:MAG: ABC transporter permease [Sedimenticola sp.]|mgnify:CR=1 FL=1|uniref:Arginine ABC transporter permease protein ArtM n=1 Tax=Sedimenticola thiotaurini TaxID=1543721 RepID=A0A558D9Y5_9GAMM|nr:ABC transporter permease [Sedimenticola sp.]TVT57801.1 MAG: ABC transporter permease [Sedimenticola thiotaurini]
MEFSVVWDNLPKLLQGAQLTLEITLLSLMIGLVIAVPVALMRRSKNPLLWMPAYGYILYFRGTPLLIQLFLIYYGSGQFRPELSDLGLWGLFREAYFCGVLALTLNTGAYTAEIFRGAIQAVPAGDVEAAKACGMGRILIFRRIILPKAIRLAWPMYGNEVVFLMQATSLVSVITLLDLTGIAGRIISKTFAVYEIYIMTALLYLAITYAIVFLFKRIEKRLNRHLA